MSKLLVALAAALVAGGLAYWYLSGGGNPAREEPESAVSLSTDTSAPAPASTSPATSAATATSPSASLAPATGSETAPAPAAPLTPAEFAKKAAAVQATLPTLDKMHALKEQDVEHRTPKIVFEAGEKIGDIADAIEKNPALAPQGLEFYGKCARRADLSFTSRALCLVNLRELSAKQGRAASENGIAPDVVKLADKLKTSER